MLKFFLNILLYIFLCFNNFSSFFKYFKQFIFSFLLFLNAENFLLMPVWPVAPAGCSQLDIFATAGCNEKKSPHEQGTKKCERWFCSWRCSVHQWNTVDSRVFAIGFIVLPAFSSRFSIPFVVQSLYIISRVFVLLAFSS